MTDTTLPPIKGESAPIDAEFEPAAEHVRQAGQRFRPGWRAFGIAALLFLVSAGLILANYGLVPGIPARANQMTELQASIESLTSELEARDQTIAGLQSSVADTRADLQRLNSNIQGASNAIERIRDDLTELRSREAVGESPSSSETNVGAVNPLILDRLEALENSLTSFPPGDANVQGDTARLETQITTLQAEIAALRDQIGSRPRPDPEAREDTANAADAALALSAIEAAARRGRPFLSGYQRLVLALPDERAVTTLAPLAATGAPTMASLSDQFPALRQRALDADAEAMGEATGWMRSVFGDSLKVRRENEVGTADLLDTASLALQGGDLGEAITQVEQLQPGARAVFSEWLDNARNRLSLENALEALRLTMIAKAAP